MIIIYGDSDRKPNASFLQEKVTELTVIRSTPYNYSKIKQFAQKDADPRLDARWKYRHHVPFQRIWLAIHDKVAATQPSRGDLLKTVLAATAGLRIEPDEFLKKYASDWVEGVRRSYDMFIDWAINALCNWQENLFYGNGSGDNGGTTVDTPTNANQRQRVEHAAQQLQGVFRDILGIQLEVVRTVSLREPEDGAKMTVDYDLEAE